MAPQELSGTARKVLPVQGAAGAQESYSWLSRWATTAPKWTLGSGDTFVSAGQEMGVGFSSGAVFTVNYTREQNVPTKNGKKQRKRVTVAYKKTFTVVEATDLQQAVGASPYTVKFKVSTAKGNVQGVVTVGEVEWDEWLQASVMVKDDQVVLDVTYSQMFDAVQQAMALGPFALLFGCCLKTASGALVAVGLRRKERIADHLRMTEGSCMCCNGDWTMSHSAILCCFVVSCFGAIPKF